MFSLKWLLPLIFGIVAFIIYGKFKTIFEPPPVPKLAEKWWGPGDPKGVDKSIRPFKIDIPDSVIDDLKYRLNHAIPFTPPLEGIQHQYGLNTDLLNEIVNLWKNKYDWKQRQNFLNKYPQFKTNIQGLDIHYLHIKPTKTLPKGTKVLPLLLLHGWPESVRQYYEIIPTLQHPQDDLYFELVIPSLPGYGFSSAATKPGLGPLEIAQIFNNLMQRLNHENYYVHGNDFGAVVGQMMACLYPDNVLGFHSNTCWVFTPLSLIKKTLASFYPALVVEDKFRDRMYPLSRDTEFLLRETGYLHLQSTKPDTVGVALKDSPVGLAAYMLEKFITGSNFTFIDRKDGGLYEKYDITALLDNIMIYWVTGSMPTSIRLYSETFNKRNKFIFELQVKVPSACARFRYDFFSPGGFIREIHTKLVHLADYEGGHFNWWLTPEIVVQDIAIGIKKMRS